MADTCAKNAAYIGTPVNNLISYKEIISSLAKEYKSIDLYFIDNISQGTGSYYMYNFREINIKFIKKLAYKRRDYILLIRIISIYQYKIQIVQNGRRGFPSL